MNRQTSINVPRGEDLILLNDNAKDSNSFVRVNLTLVLLVSASLEMHSHLLLNNASDE